jgi:hypothetical protein
VGGEVRSVSGEGQDPRLARRLCVA